jgi:pimeloyl-ACP methyl ester carboxylesterase
LTTYLLNSVNNMNQLNNPIDSQSFTSATSVIALHCSGAGAAQWRKLGETLGSRHAFVAPEHYGCDSTGPWSGERAFTLADEAAKTIGIIDASRGKVHLVGHSYGGGVAVAWRGARPSNGRSGSQA